LIDIHCHILPAIDDGPENVKEALKMAQLAVKDGVHTIIASPHCYDGVYNCQKIDILKHCVEFNNVLKKEKIPLTVLSGAEVRLTPELLLAVEQGRALTLADAHGYLLLELPELFIPEVAAGIIRSLRKAEICTILAHPERNSMVLGKREIIERLIDAGAEIQITGDSLLGAFGWEPQKMACRLLQMDARCYLASDGHCLRRRKPVLAKALKAAGKVIGKENAAGLVEIDLNVMPQYAEMLMG
jgi:protein-tyrosine phosphatase